MGPLAVYDLAGNDIGYRIRRESYYPHKPEQVAGRRGSTWMQLADAIVDAGRLGQKAGAGWYAYDGRKAVEDSFVLDLCAEHRKKHGIKARTDLTDEEIVHRCLFPLVNEGLRILEEGIAESSADVDTTWVAGYGAPKANPPMTWAREVIGFKTVRDGLLRFAQRDPELPQWQLKPCALLEEYANE